MYKSVLARLHQGHRTMRYPRGEAPAMPDRFRGRVLVDAASCSSCGACGEACPTDALGDSTEPGFAVDLGKCLFCGDCRAACPAGAISHSPDYRLSVSSRGDLVVPARAAGPGAGSPAESQAPALARALRKETLRLFGRSLRLREVSAGGCNACEADVNVLGTIGWDIGRFGIQMVASPRHADGLLVTGPVSANMELALRKTWDALCEPRIVIAVGSCAISGGPFAGTGETRGGLDGFRLEDGSSLPVSLWVPGCPPHPLTILDGLLRLLGRLR